MPFKTPVLASWLVGSTSRSISVQLVPQHWPFYGVRWVLFLERGVLITLLLYEIYSFKTLLVGLYSPKEYVSLSRASFDHVFNTKLELNSISGFM